MIGHLSPEGCRAIGVACLAIVALAMGLLAYWERP